MKKFAWILEVLAISAIFATGVVALNAAESNAMQPDTSLATTSAPIQDQGSCVANVDLANNTNMLAEGKDCPYKKSKEKAGCGCDKAKDGSVDKACDGTRDCASCEGKDADCEKCPHKKAKTEKAESEA
jgi:hypothetical protein